MKTLPPEPLGTAGARRRRQLCGAAGMAVLTLAARPRAARAQSAFDLAALMALLAQRTSGQTRFSEERHVSALEGPLRSSGQLSFTAPDRFTRQTLEPRPETLAVHGNTLLLTRSGRTRQLALDAIPEAAAMVEAVRSTLTGDSRTLRRHFAATVSGHARQWGLVLTPVDAAVTAVVRQVHLVGTGADLRSVEVQLANGDRSLMLIEPMAAKP